MVLAEYLMSIHLEVPMVVHPWLWAGWAVEKGLYHRKLHRQKVMMAWCKAVCLLQALTLECPVRRSKLGRPNSKPKWFLRV